MTDLPMKLIEIIHPRAVALHVVSLAIRIIFGVFGAQVRFAAAIEATGVLQ
jgi:hypothetical protein